jgi:hypothetical protein
MRDWRLICLAANVARPEGGFMAKRRFSPGEQVIYRRFKYTSCPGPRATHVIPSPRGEHYAYHVDKFWIVLEELDDDTLVVLTRRGRQRFVRRNDPKLRRPSLWERIRYGHQFPKPTLLTTASSASA